MCSCLIQRWPHWFSCLANYHTNCLQHVESMHAHWAKISDYMAEFQEVINNSIVLCMNGGFKFCFVDGVYIYTAWKALLKAFQELQCFQQLFHSCLCATISLKDSDLGSEHFISLKSKKALIQAKATTVYFHVAMWLLQRWFSKSLDSKQNSVICKGVYRFTVKRNVPEAVLVTTQPFMSTHDTVTCQQSACLSG